MLAKMQVKYLVPIAILLIALSLFWPHSPKASTHHVQQPSYVSVKSVAVTQYYHASGTVQPAVESKLESQITAKVEQVLVQPGDKVKAGQTLIQLDKRDYQAKFEKAKQGVSAAEAVYKQREQTYQRMQKLIGLKYVTKEEFGQSKSQYLQATAALNQAQKSLKEAQVALSYTDIKAPANGIVLNKFVSPGDQATPGKVLLSFQTNNGLRLVADVPERLLNRIKLSHQLQVQLDIQQTRINGVVTEIVPAVNMANRSTTVKVTIPELGGIYPGMFGRLLVPVATTKVLMIPADLVQHYGQLDYVYVLVNGQKQRVMITLGSHRKDGLVEVLSGLNIGDKIAAQGVHHAA